MGRDGRGLDGSPAVGGADSDIDAKMTRKEGRKEGRRGMTPVHVDLIPFVGAPP